MANQGNQRDFLIITNNPLTKDKLEGRGYFTIDFRPEMSYRDILVAVRDLVYSGRTLYTHPLSGSIKPKETPYKSVIVSVENHGMDTDQAMIISDALEVTDKFREPQKTYSEQVRKDFQLVDYCLICGALGLNAEEGFR